MTLARRLMLLVLVALLPAILIQALNIYDLRQQREVEVKRVVVQRAERIARDLEQIVEATRSVLQTLAETSEIRNGDADQCLALIRTIRAKQLAYDALGVIRSDGIPLCLDASPTLAKSSSAADRPFFTTAMASGEFTVGRYAYGRVTQTHVLHFAQPYRDPQGQTAGVLFASLSLQRLAQRLGGPEWNQDLAFSIVDTAGTILVRQPDFASYVGKPFPSALWERVAGQTATGTYEVQSPLDGVVRIVGFVPPTMGPQGMYVGVGWSRSQAFQALNDVSARATALLLVSLFLAMLLAWFFARNVIVGPVAKLVRSAERWSAGDLSARSHLRGTDELSRLGRSFDDLAGQLEAALAHKDVLIREMAHRVMNSLQVVAGVFRIQGRQSDQAETKLLLDDAAARLNAIAKVYHQMHVSSDKVSVDFSQLLSEICESLGQSLLDEPERLSVKADPIHVNADTAASLALLVNELVTNAIKHGSKHTITVRLGSSGDGWRLVVRNAGDLPPGYNAMAFKGFGMQVIASVLKQLGARLEVSSMAGETEFAVVSSASASQSPRLVS